MDGNWKVNRFWDLVVVGVFLWFQNLGSGLCLNEEGLALLRLRERVVSDPFGALRSWNGDDGGELDPCSWYGVECSNGKVVNLNLNDLCLEGTLAPELGNLVHLKSIVLRNNLFSGTIPEEIGELGELEVLDLGYNNFSGQIPSKLGNNLSLSILLLDNNELLAGLSLEIHEFTKRSEAQVDENQLSGGVKRLSCNLRIKEWYVRKAKDDISRRVMIGEAVVAENATSESSAGLAKPPAEAPTTSQVFSTPSPPSTSNPIPPPPSTSNPTPPPPTTLSKSKNQSLVLVGITVGSVIGVGLLLLVGIFFCRTSKIATVKPWATGISGQLQKAFVTGVPNLKRSELETACEDFSNVIGSSSIGIVYKGTLSSGVEIAVTSIQVKSLRDWSVNLETQFRRKIEMLSRLNHKNFVNLIGYCEEDEPFTRMMVFEYAPNGTLFEHIHIKESEHLDWGMRMRIAMGMSYCLEYMHQLAPSIPHKNLNSSAVSLTEDYAAKISDFNFWNQIAASEIEYAGMELLSTRTAGEESNVYSFGVILYEMITGRLPYSAESSSIEDWASHYLKAEQPLREKVDPRLASFDEEQLEEIEGVVRSCVEADPGKRPSVREVSARLREITRVTPEGATPRLSPLWWAELEIASADGE